uniref:Uncharacterized protein n=1 Tax=Proboscia inermis TaxID=420281 RepID=A0A7S0GCA6_9STRA|mmetsp:Transcript_24519/g.24957  ORF Transcript_24519/g.24957 Transcript_24519/m.24957 type:complete len:100 (+) Transcript_24519:153-452(+)
MSNIVEQPNNYSMDDAMETIRLDSIHKRLIHSRANSPREDHFLAPDPNRSRVSVGKKKRLSVGNFVKQCSTLSLFLRDNKNSNSQNSNLVKRDNFNLVK